MDYITKIFLILNQKINFFFLKKILLLQLKTMIVIKTNKNTIAKVESKCIYQFLEPNNKSSFSITNIVFNYFHKLQPN
jgi:hypothetical protein